MNEQHRNTADESGVNETARYLILARTAALRSVFWKSARTNCFTSVGPHSAARGPLPSAQRSEMLCRLAFKMNIISLNLFHLRANWWMAMRACETPPVDSSTSNHAGHLAVNIDMTACSCVASSADMSSNDVIVDMISTSTEFNNVPKTKAAHYQFNSCKNYQTVNVNQGQRLAKYVHVLQTSLSNVLWQCMLVCYPSISGRRWSAAQDAKLLTSAPTDTKFAEHISRPLTHARRKKCW